MSKSLAPLADRLWDAALVYLGRAESSVQSVRRMLARRVATWARQMDRPDDPAALAAIEAVIVRLQRQGAVDDARFAAQKVLSLSRDGRSGRAIAAYLSTHPKVTKLAYPGHKSHPQYDLAVKQQKGFGSMMSFELQSRAEVARFLAAIKIFLNAESLGGVESLASHSATTTHGSVSQEFRDAMGITEGRIRLSIGIEDKEDLIADLDQALRAV